MALMHIAIDAGTWFNGRGFGRFTRELVTEMLRDTRRHEFTILFDREPMPDLPARCINVAPKVAVTEAAVADGSRGIADMLRFTRAAGRSGANVLFYPAIYSWFPAPPGLRNVVTFHDAIPERFPELMFASRLDRWRWSAKVACARRQATRVLTVSESARTDLIEILKLDATKVDLTTEGPAPHFVGANPTRDGDASWKALCATLGLGEDFRYFCYVGGFAPHKNVPTVVRAFDGLGKTTHRLLLAGDPSSHGFESRRPDLEAAIRACRHNGARVHFTGFLPESALAELYRRADALVMPSLSEGFGLPAVESMACGTPVIASRAGSLPEVIGDAGVLLDPHDVDGITAAMRRLSSDTAALHALRDAARARAARFSWHRAAELALDSLERAASESRT